MNLLQRAELRVAVSAPASAKEDDSDRTAAKQIFRTPQHAIAIGQFESRSVIAGLERAAGPSGVNEFFSRQIDHGQTLGRDHGAQLCGERVEWGLQAH